MGRSVVKCFYLTLLLCGIACLAVAVVTARGHRLVNFPHLITSAGLFFDIAGIIQLELSGAFESLMSQYGDVSKYPYGPPSHITRQIIDDADHPWRTAPRNILFFDHLTGIWLIILGFVLQLLGTWI